MAPRTRGTIQRLASINAAAFQQASPVESTSKQVIEHETGHSQSDKNEHPLKNNKTRRKSTSTNDRSTPLFGPKSKLTKIDLGAFLSDDKVWNALNEEQKFILKSACPSTSTWGKTSSEQPTMGLLLYDMHWKSDVRIFEENLRDGFCEQEWIDQAKEATSERLQGNFDNWKLENFEQYWGQKMKEHDQDRIQGTQHIPFSDLFNAKQIQVGDNWLYSRSFGKGKKMIIVEYNFEVVGNTDDGNIAFKIGLPTRVVSSNKRLYDSMIENDEDMSSSRPTKRVRLSEVSTAQNLEQATPDDAKPASQLEDDTEQTSEPTQPPQRRSDRRLSSTLIPMDVVTENTGDSHIKSILKKTPMTMVLLKSNGLGDLEQQLLQYDGREQTQGKADTSKYFGIRRGGQDIGSLHDILQAFKKKDDKGKGGANECDD